MRPHRIQHIQGQERRRITPIEYRKRERERE